MSIGSRLYDIAQRYPAARHAFHVGEATMFGTSVRKHAASFILDQYHRSEFRRKWLWWNYGEPHFTDHRDTFWRLYKGDMGEGVYSLFRGFNAAQHIKKGDRVLDIGCGDGGYTKRFLAPRALEVIAVDLEPSAITAAIKNNSAGNIAYSKLDAVSEPLPSGPFDVVVMDGVLGHVSTEGGNVVLAKIKNSLSEQGWFCGSESIGHEGHDHLQFFETEAALKKLLIRHFANVSIKTQIYKTGTIERAEAVWECH